LERRKNQFIPPEEQNNYFNIEEFLNDMMDRDKKAAYLIHEAEKVSTKIDTTNLEFEQVVEKIISMVVCRLFHIKYDRYFKVLFVFIFIFIYKLINIYI